MRSIRIAGVAALAALAGACAGNGTDDDAGGLPAGAVVVPSERIVAEQYSGIEERQRRVIRSEAEWAAFWDAVYAGRTPRPPRPSVDFDREIVVAATSGRHATGGYAIEIVNVYRVPGGLAAQVLETSPAPDCVLSQAITAPVHAVRVPVVGRDVRFIERERVRPCE